MTSPQAEEFHQLNRRLQTLLTQHAVLKAQEEDKAKKREVLVKRLEERGIDTKNLEQEAARLQKEIDEQLMQATTAVDEFEAALSNAIAPKPQQPSYIPLTDLDDILANVDQRRTPPPHPEHETTAHPIPADDIDIS